MGLLVSDLGAGRQLIETHISWVFLGADDVYKVKKPVCLSFLDFTHLTERKRICEIEVQLNQRLSHDVYWGVVPVVCSSSGVHSFGASTALGGENPGSEIVDYAVHMRRLADADRWDVLLAKGNLTNDAVTSFAEHLAQFHAHCGTNAELQQLGLANAIRINVDENFSELGGALELHLPRAHAVALPLLQRDFLDQHGALFDARMRSGKVRDGHGDLRLEHVYAERSGIQVLDCIEFNDRFRYADVCADLAFITMDLRHHARPDLAEALAAAYAAKTCDFELYSLLNFYESYRAVVRAKVTHLALSNAQSSASSSERAHAELSRYLTQAFDALHGPERTPRVVAVGGLIGSGKSHTARELGTMLRCPTIASDRLRKHLHQTDVFGALPAGSFDGAYSEAATERTYAYLLEQALHVLRSGRSVVLDATFRAAAERERLLEFCQANGVPVYFVECRADEATLRQRLRAREHQPNVSDARESLLDDFMRRYEAPSETELTELCRLDTSLPESVRKQTLTQFLNT